MELRGCEDFDPVHIFECGQCFRWNPLPGNPAVYLGAAGGRLLTVRAEDSSEGKIITLANTGLRDYYAFWENYFDMKRDYAAIRRTLSERDAYLKEAAARGSGLRILRQEPFETLISFILSSNNNIPRIKGCVERLAERYGVRIETGTAFERYLRENETDILVMPHLSGRNFRRGVQRLLQSRLPVRVSGKNGSALSRYADRSGSRPHRAASRGARPFAEVLRRRAKGSGLRDAVCRNAYGRVPGGRLGAPRAGSALFSEKAAARRGGDIWLCPIWHAGGLCAAISFLWDPGVRRRFLPATECGRLLKIFIA